jgi:hypothetical protein
MLAMGMSGESEWLSCTTNSSPPLDLTCAVVCLLVTIDYRLHVTTDGCKAAAQMSSIRRKTATANLVATRLWEERNSLA